MNTQTDNKAMDIYPTPLHTIPTVKGIYILICQADTTATVQIGKLGELKVSPGYYLYIGSAKGMGGIRRRVQRHQKIDKKLHWHIDYLPATVCAVWVSETLGECECVERLLQQLPNTQRAMLGFGASDCHCGGHLLYSATEPTLGL